MIRPLFLVAALMLAPAAYGQGAMKVRAIEYPEITRLVLPARADATWSLRRDGATAILTFPGLTDIYDVSDVPRQIPRTRVLDVSSDVSATGTKIEIALGCGCDVDVRRLDQTLVAIDIRRTRSAPTQSDVEADSEAPSEVGQTETKEPSTAPTAQSDPVDEAITTGPGDPSDPMPEEATEDEGADQAADTMTASKTTADREADVAQSPTTPTVDPRLREAREALIGELGIAARDGLIRLSPSGNPEAADPSALEGDADGNRTSPVGDIALQEERPRNAIEPAREEVLPTDRIRSRAPHDPLEDRTAAATAPRGASCPPPGAVDVAGWTAQDEEFLPTLAALRRDLISSEGDPDRQAIRALARFYILHGFGHEARLILRHPQSAGIEGMDALLDVARVVDGGAPARDGALLRAEGCGGLTDLWRAAGGIDLPDYASETGGRILGELSRMPPDLRRLIAQRLAQNALIFGEEEGVEAIFDILDRTPGESTGREAFLRHLLDVETGADGNAESDLLRLASAEPLLLELYGLALIAADAQPAEAILDVVEDVERVHRDRPGGAKMRQLRARLIAHADDPGQALALLARGQDRWPNEAASLAATGRVVLNALDPTDTASIQLAVRHQEFIGADAGSKALAMKYAEALLDAGLANAAQDMLARSQGDLPGRAGRMLAARIALAIGEPDTALTQLTSIAGDEADALRGVAYRQMADWVRAHDVAPADAAPDRAYLALLGGLWDSLDADALAPEKRPLAALIEGPVAAPDISVQSEAAAVETLREEYLGRMGALVGRAAELRASVDGAAR